jgi:type I restriction enzyme S subunit
MTGVKNVPELRFSEFSYEWSKSKTPIRIVAGKAYPMSAYSDSGIMLVQGQNIFPNELKVEMPVFIPDSKISESDVQINQNDILLGLNRPVIGNKLKACLYRDNRKAVLYQRAGKLVFDKSKLSSGFLYQYLFSAVFTKQLLGELVGSDQPYIKSELFNVTKNIFPELQEQQEIADFLSSMDKKIEQLTEKHSLLTEYKKGVMQQIFSQQIRFKDEQSDDYPEWEVMKAEYLFYSHSNKNHKSDLPILAATQNRGVIPRSETGLDIYSSDASIASYKVIEPGDFLISLRSFQGGIEYSEYLGIGSPAYTVLKPKKDIVNSFYKFYFKKEDFISRLSNTVVGIRDGKQISYSAFATLKLPYPCIEEQQKIANFITEIDNKIDQAWSVLEQTKAFKKGLLQKMFV